MCIRDRQNEHSRDARLRLADALCESEAAIEEPGPVPYLSTACDCLRVASRETKPVQQKQGVCGRGPLWAVESIRPTPVVGLGREQAGTPALDLSLGSFGVCLLYTSDAADDLTRVDHGG